MAFCTNHLHIPSTRNIFFLRVVFLFSVILDNVIHGSNEGFFLCTKEFIFQGENCSALFVSGKEISLQRSHPLFLIWHLNIDSKCVAVTFWIGHLFSSIWSAADSKGHLLLICITRGFPRNTVVFSWLLKSLARREDMRLQLKNSSPHFLFLSIRRLGWRCLLLFGRAMYLLSEQK